MPPVDDKSGSHKTITEEVSLEKSYDYNNANNTFILDPKLEEISGLSFDGATNVLFAINDEEGSYYMLDPDSGEVISAQKFSKKGDYESIEVSNTNVIIMKNNGDIFFVDKKSKETNKVKTSFSRSNDLEGMALSFDQKSLLLACKGQSLFKEKSKKEKYVYAFDIDGESLDTHPYLTISDDTIINFYNQSRANSKSKVKKSKSRLKSFAPSGIAVHPVSGDIYIISAKGSSLVVFNNEKQLKDVILLDNKTNPQPEGICFDTDSNLYISTEGAGFSGKIFKYKPL